MSSAILYEYSRKWEEYFEEIHPCARWEAMATLLASELEKERKMTAYLKKLNNTSGVTKNA